MGGKSKYIRIRADEDLKRALKDIAQRFDRKEADQARYILRIALGLTIAEEEAVYHARAAPQLKRKRVIGHS